MKISRIFEYLKPPKNWLWPVNFTLALFLGLFLYAFYVSNAVSYLSDDPRTCVNCHVMRPEFATWQHSSHREVATCNDCHVPQHSFLATYYFKAKDGLRHATMFTLRAEPQVIQMHEDGIKVVQENCKACHQHLNEQVSTINVTRENNLHGEGKLCWDCHREVPHGKVKGLAATPDARVPLLSSPVPEWLKQTLKNTKN